MLHYYEDTISWMKPFKESGNMGVEKFSYEQAAEIRKKDFNGWCCKSCDRYYGEEEHIARYCCAKDLPCNTPGCKGRAEKPYVCCKECLKKYDRERWLALPEIPWDGETPLCIHDDDTYFYSPEEIDDYLEDHDLKAEDIRLVICEHVDKPEFDMSALLEDYLCEDQEVDNVAEIEKIVNKWIEDNVPEVWYPGKKRPTLASIRDEKSETPA